MGSVNPSPAQRAQLEEEGAPGGSIVMLNLLRFRDLAEYEAGASGGGVTGREAYDRYSRAVIPLLLEVGGAPIWRGNARMSVIAPEGEEWDEVVLVQYPSRKAFLRMVRSRAYGAILHHRTAALRDSRLIETTAVSLPRWVLRGAGAALRAKALLFPAVEG
jgi:uncharacterized protein (DUF1330 family)